MKKWFDYGVHVSLAALVVMAAGTWVWWMAEPVPMTWKSEVWVSDLWGVQRAKFLPGEEAIFERAYCQRKPVPAKVLRRFVSQKTQLVHELESLHVWRGTGCFKTAFGITIPRLPSGEYRFEVEAYLDTNPIRVDHVTLPAVMLTILPEAEWQPPRRRAR